MNVRFAPSPTGYLHIGGLGMAICNYMLARTNGGKNFLRIEDTDQKREVKGATELLIKNLAEFGITYDAPPIIQSQRVKIYGENAQKLVDSGRAYRDYNEDGSYAVRLKAPPKTTVKWHDLVKGDMALTSIERDPVILKSNGIPPYNFAHVVDDTLMKTTHVVRGEEWLSSTAEHIQIWQSLYADGDPKKLPPWQYVHMPVFCIEENGNKRKLSKRKDREALVQTFLDEGYPKQALIEYVLTLLNTDYELWRTANPNVPWRDFKFRFEKIGSNSPLFDWAKLNDISKNIIANMSQDEIEKEVKQYFGKKMKAADLKKINEILSVDRGTARPRKDIAKYSEIMTEFDYILKPAPKVDPAYVEIVRASKDKDDWFERVKAYCDQNKLKVRDYTQSIRVQLTGREKTTDLYTISKLMLLEKDR